jgi:flagellar M-ring protein FliF
MEPLNRYLALVRKYWAGFSTLHRLFIVGAGVLLLVGVIGYTYFAPGGGYVPLHREPIPQDETASIVAKLKSLGLPYQLDPGEGITVPRERLVEIQVTLAGEGVPVRGKGFELFDETSLTSTPFSQNVNYQRAIQTELSRQIGLIDGVAAARVIIARPESGPFGFREQTPPTASVVVKVKPNARLSRQSAASIVALVSHAVVGMKPENVTVVDTNGVTHSDPHAGEKENLPTKHLEYRQELESYLASKAQQMLVAHLGFGRAIVQVNADINFQKLKERQERYAPDEKVPIAERLINSSNTSGRAGGVAGADSNIRQTSGGSGGSGNSKEETIQTDYAVSKTVREMEDRAGAIKQLSVAVFVDLTPPTVAEGQPAPTLISATETQEIVKQAIGLQPQRGDKITVTNVRLGGWIPTAVEPDEEEAKIRRFAAYVTLTRNICMALAVVGLLSLIPLALLRRRTRVAEAPIPLQVASPAEPTLEQKRKELIDRFVELARTDPDRTASVFGLLVGPSAG